MRFRGRSLVAWAALAATALLSSLGAGDYAWKTARIGGGGFVTGVVFHPTERGLVYARTDVGGAYRWDALTSRWIALNDGIGGLDNEFMLLGVLSLAVDPNDADRLYLACGQYLWNQSWNPSAMLRSSDRGASWERVGVSFKNGGNSDGRGMGERLQVDPNDGSILFMGTSQDGLWRSGDHAATWTRVATFAPTACSLVLFDPSTGTPGGATQTIYVGVATTSVDSLYRSTDGGATWTAVPGQPTGQMPHHASITAGPDKVLYLAYANGPGPNNVTAGSVWKLDPGSGQWTDISPPAGQGGFAGLAVDASDPLHLVVSTIDRWWPGDAVFESRDGGATWRDVLTGADLDLASAPWAAASSPHWISDVDLDPFNPDRAMFVTGYGLFETEDLGATGLPTWRFRNDELEETVVEAVVSPPEGARLVSVMGDIDGIRHDDLVTAPAARHAPRWGTGTSIDFAELAPSVMARTSNAGMRGALSNDGGGTWTAFASAPSTSVDGGRIAVNADGTRLVWAENGMAVHFSINGGNSWTPSAGAPAGRHPTSDRVNPLRFYIHDSSAGRVYVSSDGGATFTAGGSVPTGGAVLRSVPGREGHLWLPCSGSGLWRSTNSGTSFTSVGSVQRAYAVGFGKSAPGSDYPAVFLWGRVGRVVGLHRSDDEGGSWSRINDDAHQFGYIRWMTGDPRIYGRVYLATGGRGVVYGDLPAALPQVAWAPFERGQPGQFVPAPVTGFGNVVFAAQGLPAWATLDPATGTIGGTATDDPGTLHQVSLSAWTGGDLIGTMTVNLIVGSAGSDLRVTNLSARAWVGAGDQILIPGVIVSGSGSRRFLIRGIGPSLVPLGVEGVLADPNLTLMANGTVLDVNDNWAESANAAAIRSTAAAVWAFPLIEGGADGVLLHDLAAGAYSTKVEGVGETAGVALVEVYDASESAGGAQLTNISARAFVGTGDGVLIPGLILEGGGSRRLLVRAVGPTLAAFNVEGVLPDPQLSLFKGSTVLASNDNWNDAPDSDALRAVAAGIYAFALPEGSRDAALLATLPEGAYTMHVSGVGGTTGIALVEVYVLE